MTALRLLVALLCIVPRIAWAWLKTKMPSRRAPIRHCQECGWVLRLEETLLVCQRCEAEAWTRFWPWVAEYSAKLFCCDVDLEYEARESTYSLAPGENGSTVTKRYRCPTCDRIWLYIEEQHKDSGSDADWYPQQTKAEVDGDGLPDLDLFDERIRTKVYH